MITFKKFLVEKIVGNTGWVYHRTKKNPEESSIVTHGIKPSTNQSAMYGKGLYCCYDLNKQLKPNMKKYGAYILKGKIDLNGFAILDEDIFRLANPRGDFEKHLKQIGTSLMNVKSRSILPYTSRIAQNIWEKCKQDGYNGIIFTGESDGEVAVVWNRRNFIPYQYSEDNAATWKTLTPDIKSIKRPHDPEYDKDDQAIKFSKILKEISRKEEIGDLYSPDSYNNKIFLKNLKKSGNISTMYATELNLPQLRESGNISANNATELNLPQLQTSGEINANSVTTLNLPQLRESWEISAPNATELNLLQLRESWSISADNATELNLPQLRKSWGIYAKNATELNLPQLRESWEINAKSAKKIIIPKHLINNLIDVPSDCEIIHPEDTPQVKVDENTTFKKYLVLKESLVQI